MAQSQHNINKLNKQPNFQTSVLSTSASLGGYKEKTLMCMIDISPWKGR